MVKIESNLDWINDDDDNNTFLQVTIELTNVDVDDDFEGDWMHYFHLHRCSHLQQQITRLRLLQFVWTHLSLNYALNPV